MAQGESESGGSQPFHSDSGRSLCSSCRRDMPSNVRFCPYCGQETRSNPGVCLSCGASNRPEASFCANCGSVIDVTPPQTLGVDVVARTETEYMGFWIRLAAAVIDGIITGVIGGIIGALTGVPAIGSLFSLLYYVLFTGLKGQTPGKMALGIQVVNLQYEVPGVPRAILREVLGKLVSTVAILLGFFWIGWDRHKRGWHDHISGTYVIRKQRNRP